MAQRIVAGFFRARGGDSKLLLASSQPGSEKEPVMRIVYKRCCGMDVHKNSVTACVLVIDEDGEFRKQSRYFSTMTRDLKEMATWLANLGVEAIAMEATGVYWKPVWNILEAEKKYQ